MFHQPAASLDEVLLQAGRTRRETVFGHGTPAHFADAMTILAQASASDNGS
jgi:hypothetical protein